jgi:hypothetical protein
MATTGLALLTSCTVPVDGVTGVRVNRSGVLLGVIASCEHRINAAVMYETSGSTASEAGPTLGSWDLHGDSTRAALTWSLTDSTSLAATSDEAPHHLPARRLISVYGATHDNSYSTSAVSFRLSNTTSLRSGQILTLDLDSIETGRERNKVVSVREFQRLACED